MRSLPAAMALSVLLLTACTGSNLGDVPEPAGSQPPLASEGPSVHLGTIALRWHLGSLPGVYLNGGRAVLESPTRLAFVSGGSSNCPSLPTSLDVLNPNTIRMDIAPYPPTAGGCVLDLTSFTVEVAIDPSLVDVGHSLNIQLVSMGGSYTLVAPGLPTS